jgi:predicted RND superfamily exporter protein
MAETNKIIICVKDENPDCKLVEKKLMELFESLDQDVLKKSRISLHMPECNLMNFVHKEKEFTKNILSKRMMVKFNHKLVSHDESSKEVTIEKSDRAGNVDTFKESYDQILIIDTNPQ